MAVQRDNPYGAFRFRVGGVYFAILTIALAEFARIGFDHLAWTGGTAGLFLPAVVMGSGAWLELLHPFAVSLLLGLVSEVAVVLVALPNLYPAVAGLRPLPPPPDEDVDVSAPPDGQSAIPHPRASAYASGSAVAAEEES